MKTVTLEKSALEKLSLEKLSSVNYREAGEVIGSFLVSSVVMFTIFAVLVTVGSGSFGFQDIGLMI